MNVQQVFLIRARPKKAYFFQRKQLVDGTSTLIALKYTQGAPTKATLAVAEACGSHFRILFSRNPMTNHN